MSEFDPSQPLDKPKHELFAQEYAGGSTLLDAYEAAGYARIRQSAHKFWLTNADVQERVLFLQEQNAAEQVITRREVQEGLKEVAMSARGAEQYSAAVSAYGQLSKMNGYDAPKRLEVQIKPSLNSKALSDEAQAEILAARDAAEST